MSPVLKWTGIVVAAAAVVVALFLALFDWNLLRGPIARFASERSGRPVQIGHLDVEPFSLKPRATVSALRVGNPRWMGQSRPMAEVPRATIQLALLPLFKGDIVLPQVVVERPSLYLFRNAAGRSNWETQRRPAGAARSEPPDLPAVRRFVVNDGRLRVIDEKRKLRFTGSVGANETAAQSDRRPFRLEGEGDLNGKPFELEVDGKPLINVDPDEPYPFEARIRAGDTRLAVDGYIPRPFDLARFRARTTMQGNDLADLYYLTGLALPNTLPYKVSGLLFRNGSRVELREASGTVGDSDLRGQLTVDVSSGRPFLTARLESRTLDIDDLAAPLGAAPSLEKGETASPRQVAVGKEMAARGRIFPDANLQLERIRAMDASVQYRADSVKTRKIPLRRVIAELKLDHGLLTIKPLSFVMPQGRLSGSVRLDARKDEPQTTMDLRLSDVRLSQFRPRDAKIAPLEGTLIARAELRGRGDSVHDTAASADGAVSAVVPRGEVREAFAELTGINVAKGLGLLLRKDQQQIGIRCGVAEFKVRNGRMATQNLIFDTENVLITGRGAISLGGETLDLTIQGHPKRMRLFRVRSPIEIQGPLRKPGIGIGGASAAAQTGAAVALGTLVAPLAAVIAFVDPGLAKDANCGALLAEAGQGEAPVRTAKKDIRTAEKDARPSREDTPTRR